MGENINSYKSGSFERMRALILIISMPPLLTFPSLEAIAATEEIQVYMDEMNNPGEFGLEVHSNYVFSGNTIPDYPGAQTPAHVFRLTPEFSYGLTDNFELGAYLLSSRDAYNSLNIDGEKLRLKYIAPKELEQTCFFGANFEIGTVAHRLDPNPWGAQLKGIYGNRLGRWTFAVNPNISWAVSGSIATPATLEIDTKLSYAIKQDYAVGLESYNGTGSINTPLRTAQQNQNLYMVLDTDIGGFDLNLGIGRGFTPISDKWVAKAIVSIPFSKR
jgi:hypothetical protein